MTEEWMEDYSHLRQVPNVGLCGIAQMVFTWGLFVGLTELGYEGRYCYRSQNEAAVYLAEWNGEGDPGGDWLKKKGFGKADERKKI